MIDTPQVQFVQSRVGGSVLGGAASQALKGTGRSGGELMRTWAIWWQTIGCDELWVRARRRWWSQTAEGTPAWGASVRRFVQEPEEDGEIHCSYLVEGHLEHGTFREGAVTKPCQSRPVEGDEE